MADHETSPRLAPWVRPALEFGPVVAFFLGYLWLKDASLTVGGTTYQGFIVVTAAFIPLLAASTLLLWRLTGTLSRMQVLTLVMVVVFGGLSVWLNDERFFKVKPTIVYLVFALILGIGLVRGQSYLAAVLGSALPLRPAGWMILTQRMGLFWLALAAANEAVWRTQSTDLWVTLDTFGVPAAMFAFFMAQAGLLKRYEEAPPTQG